MPRNSLKQIEKDELRILGELRKKANKSINDIAETCGFSRQKVWRVIKNLEKNHTIWGYTAVIDEEKLDKKGYILLVKRTNKPTEKKLINQIVSRELVDEVKKIGIVLTNSFFTNGRFDWIMCFTANDVREAKGFVEIFNKLYEGYISETHLLENMFSAVNCGVTNPDIKKLNDFFKM